MILSSIVQYVSIARIELLLSNITYESRCAAASGEHGLRAVELCFQFHFQTFPPTTRRSQTNGTEPPICFSTAHDIRAARFNAARGYSRARTRSISLSLSARICDINISYVIIEMKLALARCKYNLNLYIILFVILEKSNYYIIMKKSYFINLILCYSA